MPPGFETPQQFSLELGFSAGFLLIDSSAWASPSLSGPLAKKMGKKQQLAETRGGVGCPVCTTPSTMPGTQ